MSVCVSLCHFMSLSDLLPLSRCKDTKRKFGTVTFCHYLSPFVTFQQIAFSRCKVTKKDFGTVRICPHMSGNVRFCPHFFYAAKLRKEKLALSIYVQLCPFVSIYVHLCPATTWQCLIPFSLQSYEIENWHCPNLSNYVQICPFNFVAISLSPHIVWNLRYSTLNESKDLP